MMIVYDYRGHDFVAGRVPAVYKTDELVCSFDGVPWGLFLSTQELAKCPGGLAELDAVVEAGERKMERDAEERKRLADAGAQGNFSPWPRANFSPWPQEGRHIPSEVSAPACKLPEE